MFPALWVIASPSWLPKGILRTVGVVPNVNVDVRSSIPGYKGIRHRGKASATPKLSSLAKTHKKPKERGVDLFPALAMEAKLRTTSKVVAGSAHGKVSKASTWLWKLMTCYSLVSKPLLQEGRISVTFSLTVDCHRSKSTHPFSQSCISLSPRRHRFCSYPASQKHAMGEEDTKKSHRTRIGPASILFSYTLFQSTNPLMHVRRMVLTPTPQTSPPPSPRRNPSSRPESPTPLHLRNIPKLQKHRLFLYAGHRTKERRRVRRHSAGGD